RLREPVVLVDNDRFERSGAALGDRLDACAFEPRDATRGHHPEIRARILEHERDQAIASPLRDAEPLVAAVAQTEQTIGAAANPQLAAAVDQKAGDILRGRTLAGREHAKASVLVDRKPVAVRSNPHPALAILRERREDMRGDAVRLAVATRQ